ncbi:MAG: hypothetical protein V1663_00880 [archaeon]
MEKKKTKSNFIKPTLPKMIVFILLLIFFNPGTIHAYIMSTEYYNCLPEDCKPASISWEYKLPWDLELSYANSFLNGIFLFFIPIIYIISCLIAYIITKVKGLKEHKV